MHFRPIMMSVAHYTTVECYEYIHCVSKQESCTVAKMTARCALFYPNFVHAYVHYFERI